MKVLAITAGALCSQPGGQCGGSQSPTEIVCLVDMMGIPFSSASQYMLYWIDREVIPSSVAVRGSSLDLCPTL